jgi:hypothetical protein
MAKQVRRRSGPRPSFSPKAGRDSGKHDCCAFAREARTMGSAPTVARLVSAARPEGTEREHAVAQLCSLAITAAHCAGLPIRHGQAKISSIARDSRRVRITPTFHGKEAVARFRVRTRLHVAARRASPERLPGALSTSLRRMQMRPICDHEHRESQCDGRRGAATPPSVGWANILRLQRKAARSGEERSAPEGIRTPDLRFRRRTFSV